MRWLWSVVVLFYTQFPTSAQDFTKFFADTADLQTAFSLIREPNGHIWLGGTKLPLNGDNIQVWIYRLDLNGNIKKRFRFPFDGYQTWGGMAFFGENKVGAITGNRTNSGITENWLALLDTAQILSYQKINGADNAIVDDANATRSGRLLVCGFRPGPDEEGNNYWLGKVNQNAGLDWVYETNLSPNDHIRQAQEAADGSIYFSGDIQQDSYNPIVGRLDSAGNPLWVLPVESPWNDGAQKFDFDSAGRVWLTGESSTSAGALFDTQLSIVDTSGHLVWQQILGGQGQDAAFLIQKAKNSGFWVAGYSNAFTGGSGPISPFLMKLDPEGNSEGESFWPFTSPSPVYDFESVGDSSFLFCGVSDNRAYLMKRVSPALTPVFVVGNSDLKGGRQKPVLNYNFDNQLLRFPNSNSASQHIQVVNCLGQVLISVSSEIGFVSLQPFPTGIYWIWVKDESGGKQLLGKILK